MVKFSRHDLSGGMCRQICNGTGSGQLIGRSWIAVIVGAISYDRGKSNVRASSRRKRNLISRILAGTSENGFGRNAFDPVK